MNIARVAGMWGRLSPPKPRGTTRTYRVLILKTGRSLHPTREYITGTVRAFHEEARAVCSCGESRETRAIQDRVPERVCRFEACQEYQPHTPLPQPQHRGARDAKGPPSKDAQGGQHPISLSSPTIPGLS